MNYVPYPQQNKPTPRKNYFTLKFSLENFKKKIFFSCFSLQRKTLFHDCQKPLLPSLCSPNFLSSFLSRKREEKERKKEKYRNHKKEIKKTAKGNFLHIFSCWNCKKSNSKINFFDQFHTTLLIVLGKCIFCSAVFAQIIIWI